MADQAPVLVDRRLCMGTGICVEFAPATFAHDDEAKAVVRTPVGDTDDVLATAVESCPTGALRLATAEAEA
jgi:ferredoxin